MGISKIKTMNYFFTKHIISNSFINPLMSVDPVLLLDIPPDGSSRSLSNSFYIYYKPAFLRSESRFLFFYLFTEVSKYYENTLESLEQLSKYYESTLEGLEIVSKYYEDVSKCSEYPSKQYERLSKGSEYLSKQYETISKPLKHPLKQYDGLSEYSKLSSNCYEAFRKYIIFI